MPWPCSWRRGACPDRQATLIGAVTAVYALGAMVFAQLFAWLIAEAGLSSALAAMSGVLGLMAGLGALAAHLSGVQLATMDQPAGAKRRVSAPLIALLWFGYGAGCLAGLMVIGHAAGIMAWAGGRGALLTAAIALIAIGNAAGGFAAGALADRISVRTLLIAMTLLSGAALLALALTADPSLILIWLAIVGIAYGAIIALYPAVTLAYFGLQDMARVYGRVFTAWGAAGLFGPWIAGLLYDLDGSYAVACLLAAGAALLSAVASYLLPKPGV